MGVLMIDLPPGYRLDVDGEVVRVESRLAQWNREHYKEVNMRATKEGVGTKLVIPDGLVSGGIATAAHVAADLIAEQAPAIEAALKADLEEAALADKPMKVGFRLSVKLDYDNDPPQVRVTVGYGKARTREGLAAIGAADGQEGQA